MATQIVSKFVAPNGDEYIFSDSSKAEPGTASPLMDATASTGISTKYAREDHVHPSDTSREAVSNKTTVVLGTSDSKYPTDKAVADFVNSSVATNTANYISNNGQPFTSVAQLEAYTGTVTNNDYAFVTGTDSAGNTYYDRYKATVSGSTVTWSLEYRLNNSSFTAAQWAAINSGITAALVGKIHEHANKTVLDGITATDISNWNGKAAGTHTHGNITNGGALQTTDVTIASGDKLVITDSSDSNKVARASISFDGSTTTKALTQKGTWETFNNYTHPTTSGNKHVPSGGSSGQFLGWSADGTAAWVANPNTDTKVTSSDNHYTPETASGSDKTASASGATAAWSIDVVKGVTLNTDGKGHVTGISVTSGKIPGNPNTDTKVKATAKTDNVNYKILATASASPTSGNATEAVYDTDITLNPSTNTINANVTGTVNGYTIGKSVPSNAVFTDTNTKVTSATNHYTPSRDTGADKSASATGATAAWGIDVVKGVTLQTDGKGHVTGISVTSVKVPSAVATASANGLMSSTDKAKLNGLEFMSDTENNTMMTNIISSAH